MNIIKILICTIFITASPGVNSAPLTSIEQLIGTWKVKKLVKTVYGTYTTKINSVDTCKASLLDNASVKMVCGDDIMTITAVNRKRLAISPILINEEEGFNLQLLRSWYAGFRRFIEYNSNIYWSYQTIDDIRKKSSDSSGYLINKPVVTANKDLAIVSKRKLTNGGFTIANIYYGRYCWDPYSSMSAVTRIDLYKYHSIPNCRDTYEAISISTKYISFIKVY